MIYEDWLYSKLYEVARDLFTDFDDNYKIHVYNEEEYIKGKDMNAGDIHVVIKRLTSDLSYNTIIQPMQLYIMSEANGLEVAQVILRKFAQTYNWYTENETKTISGVTHTTNYKHQYSDPAVLSNFNSFGIGYRSVLFVTASLFITEDLVDVNTVTGGVGSISVDNAIYKVSGFTFGYTMTPDTQNFGDAFCVSVKDNASLTLSIVIPCIANTLTTKVLNIMNGSSDGNTDFAISFKLGTIDYSFNMKLISTQFITAPNGIPALQLGFTL